MVVQTAAFAVVVTVVVWAAQRVIERAVWMVDWMVPLLAYILEIRKEEQEVVKKADRMVAQKEL